MNSSDTDPTIRPTEGDPRDALVDALLHEHARLGSADDESLLAAIHSRTVAKPAPTRVVELPGLNVLSPVPRKTSMREWLQIAAVVALSVALVGLFLANRSIPLAEQRNEQTFQLVSRPLTAVVVASDEVRAGIITPYASNPNLGEIALPHLDNEIATSNSFASPGNHDPVNTALLAEFSVSAETLLQLSPDRLVYEGEVILKHADFTLKADRLELASAPGDSRIGSFVAEGGELRIEKRTSNGHVEVARATSATWDADGGGIILAGGPPTLSAGNSYVRPSSSGGVIVLRADGYQVIER
ncbi:MAG: hypothetical protein KDN20_19970 [Verrucomicrobiae bacterium]|nr:hypothetical protein [Verrucomicrobiae bacterium]